MSDKEFVIVHRTFDPIQAEILGDLLRDSGVRAEVLGTRMASLVGVGGNTMELHIKVPAEQAGTATDFLEEYLRGDGVELLREEGLLDDDDEKDSGLGEPAKSRLLAAGSGVFLPFGFANVYLGRSFVAVPIAAAQIYFLFSIVELVKWELFVRCIGTMFSMVALDILLAQVSIPSGWKVKWSVGRQLITGVCIVALSIWLGSILGPRIPEPKPEQESVPEILLERTIMGAKK